MIKIYPAVFEQDTVGYGIYFPNVEGAETQGETVEDGLGMASDALGIQLAWHVENQIPLPNVSRIKDIAINKETQFVTLVLIIMSRRSRVSVFG